MSNIIIYQSDDGKTKLDVKLDNNTLWVTQEQMSTIFNRSKSTINEHILNIFEEKELEEQNVMRKFGNSDFSTKPTNYYNLDMVIAVGYRVKSKQGTQFRIWATSVLKEYIEKGFALDDERLKNNGGGDYWKELLDRIRDIRSSEKVLYRQVLDLYATSRDYDPQAPESLEFFKIVQNKLHYAAHGHTAAEVIYERVNADKPFMGLKTFSGSLPTKQEAKVAKNYLEEDELKILNNIVSGYFDFAEVYAKRHEHLYMRDYIEHLDKILSAKITGLTVYKKFMNARGQLLPLEVGPFSFEFYVFDFSANVPEKYKVDREDRDIIKQNRVYLYRDGIRVYPYGAANDDWLGIDIYRGTVSAGGLLSNDQIIGCVSISQKYNPNLEDATSREGLLNNQASQDFVGLLKILLAYIRAHPYKQYQNKRDEKDQINETKKQKVEGVFSELKKAVAGNKNAEAILNKAENTYKKEKEFLL